MLLCSGRPRLWLVKITNRPHAPYQLPMKLGKNASRQYNQNISVMPTCLLIFF